MVRLFSVLLLVILLFPLYACKRSEGRQQGNSFQQIQEMAEIKPQRPVKIKLKRNTNGNYSWELSGNDAEKIIQADRKLRDALEVRD